MKTSIIINGVEFVLQENNFYKPGNFEPKYKVLYFASKIPGLYKWFSCKMNSTPLIIILVFIV